MGGGDSSPNKTRKTVPELKIDENFSYCHVQNCWQQMPCAAHQADLLTDAPELFFMRLVRASRDIPTTVSTLIRWATWTLREEEEDKWEVAACLETQALAVHYQTPRVPEEDFSEQTETYEAEYWHREPRLPKDPTKEEKAKYDAEMAGILAGREQRAAAREQRHILRTHQRAALESIWRQIFQLSEAFLRAEDANLTHFHDFPTFMAQWETLRQKLRESPARRKLGNWTLIKAEVSHYYISTLKRLMEQCLAYASVPLNDVAIMLLGSLARAEGMPYSDVEFAVILGNRSIESKVWKAIRIFRFFIILFGETPYAVLPEARERTFANEENEGWSFTPPGFHFDTGVTLMVEELQPLVALQGDFAIDIVTRTALRQVSFLCGEPTRVQEYQSALVEFWTSQPLLRQENAKELLGAAVQKYDPQNLGDTCVLKSIYRMLALSLEAIAMWHGLHATGCMGTISLLRSKGVLQWDTAARIGSLLELLMNARMAAQMSSGSQNDCITKNADGTWSAQHAALLELVGEFRAGTVRYVQQLAEAPPQPVAMLKSILALRPIIFNLEVPQKPSSTSSSSSTDQPKPVFVPQTRVAEEQKSGSGVSFLAKLLMVKDYLQLFTSLATRMALGASCKGLRILSPGPVTTIKINSTADAQMFLDGPPTLGSHILHLGGYWAKQRPYSKRHAIARSSWEAWENEDKRRREEMCFERSTLLTLMKIRPHHRVVGLEFGRGTRATTHEDYTEFWALVHSYIGWLHIADFEQKDLDEFSRIFSNRPYVGSYLKVSGSGNCWPFLLQMLKDHRALEGLSFAWQTTFDAYYHGPKYTVPDLQLLETSCPLPFPDLQYINMNVPANEHLSPSNPDVICKWLLPRAVALRKLGGTISHEWDQGIVQGLKGCKHLKEMTVYTCGGLLPKLLSELKIHSFTQSHSSGISLDMNTWNFSNEYMRCLHLGSLYAVKAADLKTILRAFPKLVSFSVNSVSASPADAAEIEALLPHATFVQVTAADGKAILSKSQFREPTTDSSNFDED